MSIEHGVDGVRSFMRIQDRTRIRIGKLMARLAVLLSVSSLSILAILGGWDFLVETDAVYFGALGVGFGTLTWLMITPQARNGSVWALAWGSLFAATFTTGVAGTVLLTRGSIDGLTYDLLSQLSPSDLPLPAAISIHFRFWAVVPALWLPLTFGLLLFPDGSPPTPRWKWVGWWSIVAITVGTATTAVVQNPWTTLPIASAENTLPGWAGLLIDTAFAASSLGALLAVVSLVVRYRRSTGVTRSQIRWIAVGGSTFIATLAVVPNFETGNGTGVLGAVLGVAAFLVLTVSYAIAIARYRLYEIDVVISKSMTYLGLAGVITALYAVIVVGPVLLIGRSDDGGPGLMLPIVATAVVAVLFEPIRIRLQRQANRLVYGERSTPHEVLSQVAARFTDDSAGTAPDDLAQLLAEGTGAKQAVVWLRIDDTLQPEGIWQADRDAALVEPVPTDGLVEDQFTAWRPVQHNEHLFGALSVTKPRNDAITPTDAALLADVAAGAGLLLRNISLNRQLEDRARELRESRRRLITAQDAERHRLERDLHDGAQQQVVALKVKLGIARTVAEREGAADVAAHITALADDTQQAVDALRSVAHGIYPPLLESDGLEAALRAVDRSGDRNVTVETSGLTRYQRGIEAAVYFFVIEMAERARRSGASFIRVTVTGQQGRIIIDLATDAPIAGDDLRLVTDRIEALGGTTDIGTIRDGIAHFTALVPATERQLEPA